MNPDDSFCRNCKFWISLDDVGEEDRMGECYRYPPVRIENRSVRDETGWEHPFTHEDNWCGEWASLIRAPIDGQRVSATEGLTSQIRNACYRAGADTLQELANGQFPVEWRNVGDVHAARAAIVLLEHGLVPAWVRRLNYGKIRKALGAHAAEEMLGKIETLTASLEAER